MGPVFHHPLSRLAERRRGEWAPSTTIRSVASPSDDAENGPRLPPSAQSPRRATTRRMGPVYHHPLSRLAERRRGEWAPSSTIRSVASPSDDAENGPRLPPSAQSPRRATTRRMGPVFH